MNREDLRKELDGTDALLMEQFNRRMELCARIARCKAGGGIAVYDGERERTKLEEITTLADAGLEEYARRLYKCLFELSREHQCAVIQRERENEDG